METGIDTISAPTDIVDCDELLRSILLDEDFRVVPLQEFPGLVREIVEDIVSWANGANIPEEVLALFYLSDEKLHELQKEKYYSELQLRLWQGEMKLRIYNSRSGLDAIARQAELDSWYGPENLDKSTL